MTPTELLVATENLEPKVEIKSPEVELQQLVKQFPEPTNREVAADYEWFHDEANKGALDALFGTIVAVYEKRVVATGNDELALRVQLSRKYHLHPGRFVLVFHGE